MKSDRALLIISILLFVIGVGCIGYVLLTRTKNQGTVATGSVSGNLECISETEDFIATDTHMSGIVEIEGSIRVAKGYYNCNDPERGDLVLVKFGKNLAPVVRILEGVPGDKFTLDLLAGQTKYWTIDIDGQRVMRGSDPYFIKNNLQPPLKTLVDSGFGTLKKNQFLVLSNIPPGMSDSGNLGIIKRNQLIGRALSEL